MKEIKINFVDFWKGFDKTNNYFYNLLIKKYKVVIDDNPDLLFYSCLGNDYLKYNCKRIFYTGENIRPDFLACDFAFAFDYSKRKNHFRLPLYSMYIELHGLLNKLETKISKEEARRIWNTKTKFCCMVVSNPKCKERIDFFQKISKVKVVDSGGSVLNNVGGRVANKAEFIKDYKFVISFENSQYEGYTTEKILEPIFEDCIPIYWGNPSISKEFNSKRFLDFNSFNSEEDLISRLIEIDQNDVLAIEILQQPTFNVDKLSHEEEKDQVLLRLSEIIENSEKPIAQKGWKYIHKSKLFLKKNMKRLLFKLKIVSNASHSNSLL